MKSDDLRNKHNADADLIFKAIKLITDKPRVKGYPIHDFIQCPKCNGVLAYTLSNSLTIIAECKSQGCLKFIR